MTIYPPTIPQYHKYRISYRSFVLSSYTFEGREEGAMGSTPAYGGGTPQKTPSHGNEGKISPVVEHAKALQNCGSPGNQPSVTNGGLPYEWTKDLS